MVDGVAKGSAAGTVREAVGAAVDALRAAGVDAAELDAELLLIEATGWDRAHLAAEPEANVSSASARRFGQMVRRRLRREPLAYILGRKGFRHIELAVDPRVLIPRPETELVVEVALELGPITVLEVVRFIEGSVPAGLRFDLVLANLPYVSEGEWGRLQPEIREFEPREALVAGPRGTEAIESLLQELRGGPPHGAVALEVGAGQADEVAGLVRAAGYTAVEARRDLAGIQRVVLGR
jgi:release factor glutamine methyltransferase